MNNGNGWPGLFRSILDLLKDHVELAHLEYRFESGEGRRVLGIWALAALCVLFSLAFLHAALIIGLLKLGVPLYALCLGFAALYAAGGFSLYRRWGKRDPRAGEAFQGTREEAEKSLQWIHQLLS
jgi:hypothetical protein